jgi:hypothetical protein
MHYTYL